MANHFLCDFNKGIKKSSNKKILPKVLSLSNSIEMITALAESYEKVFVEQLMNYSNSEIASLFFRVQENQKIF